MGLFSSWHVACERSEPARSGVSVLRCTTVNNNRSIVDNMTRMNQWLMAAGVAAVMSFGVNQVAAQPDNAPPGGGGRQGRGNFDPAQFQQRMLERTKETLEVTDDAEWKAMQPLVQKVMDLRRGSFAGMGRGMMGRGPRGGDNPPGGDQGQRRGGMFGTPSPEAEALQKAIDSKASKAEMKAALIGPGTSNNQHPTSSVGYQIAGHWMFDVGCWLLGVPVLLLLLNPCPRNICAGW